MMEKYSNEAEIEANKYAIQDQIHAVEIVLTKENQKNGMACCWFRLTMELLAKRWMK